MDEHHRKIFHVVVGLAFALFGWLVGVDNAALAVLVVLVVGMVLMNARLLGSREPFTDFLMEKLDRTTHLPAKGAFFFALGALFSYTFFRPAALGLAAIAIVAAGDGAATLVGIHGTHKLPWHPKKTWEGTFAFFAAAAIASTPLVGFVNASLFSAIAAIAESFAIDLDDNIGIPVVLWLASLLIKIPLGA